MDGNKTGPAYPARAGEQRRGLTLNFPQKHPISWLLALHQAEHGSAAPSRIFLSLETEAALSPGMRAEELGRLEQLLTDTGRARMHRAADPGGALPALDAEAVVFLPQDGLSAWVVVYPPISGGRELTAAMLLRSLTEKKVLFGLDRALLNSLPSRMDRYFTALVLARGVAPVRGEDGRVEELFPQEAPLYFPTLPGEQVDYAALRQVRPVRQGDPICRLVPPGGGTPGVTVQGKKLPPQPGSPAQLYKGRNTELSEDGHSLLAVRDGHVIFTGRCFEVRTTLEIDGDVGNATGNLNYLGDIHIRGDVRSGFTVRAMGAITVEGVIEDSSVEAGSDLFVGQGVQGNGKTVIRAHRNVYARYLENCVICAGGDVYSDCIIGCSLYCDGSVQATAGRGAVIGGAIRAGNRVRANVIGARSELRTEVALGGQPCEDWEREQVLQELAQMEQAQAQAQAMRQSDSPEARQQIASLRLKTTVTRLRLDQIRQRPAQNHQISATPGPPFAAGHLYPGAVISINGSVRAVNRERYACSASLEHGRVRFLERGGESGGTGVNP